MSCCDTYLTLGCISHCGVLTLNHEAQATGTYTVVVEYSNSFEITGTLGEDLQIDISNFKEYSISKFQVIDPSGNAIGIMSGEVEYECFKINTREIICCTNTYDLGCFNHCAELVFGTATQTETLTVLFMSGMYSKEITINTTSGQPFTIPLDGLNEQTTYIFKLYNQDGTAQTVTIDEIEYDCFKFKSKVIYGEVTPTPTEDDCLLWNDTETILWNEEDCILIS